MILSKKMLKRVGNSRHPCLTDVLKQLPMIPVKWTACVALSYRFSVTWTDVVHPYFHPQGCMSHSVEAFLEVNEDMVEFFLVLG